MHSWIERFKEIQQTKVEKFIPNANIVREIVEVLLLPAVNLKRQIGDILVKLNRETIYIIKVKIDLG